MIFKPMKKEITIGLSDNAFNPRRSKKGEIVAIKMKNNWSIYKVIKVTKLKTELKPINIRPIKGLIRILKNHEKI